MEAARSWRGPAVPRGYAGRVHSELIFAHAGFGANAVPYLDGWALQRQLHDRRAAGQIPDTCLLLEHEAVYTAGRRTEPLDRPLTDPGIPVIDVDRGGKITWHGPGQLVGYPIMALGEPLDVVAYVRTLEEALIRCCAEMGVATTRVEGRSGVWVTGGGPDRKVGAVGIRVSRGVTMHGFALNCDCDLGWFDKIVPCGIRDAGVTSLTAEARRPVTVAEMTVLAEHHLADVFRVSSWHRASVASLLSGAELSPAAP